MGEINILTGEVSVMGQLSQDIEGSYTLASAFTFEDLPGTIDIVKMPFTFVRYVQTTQAAYDAIATKDKGTIYFLEDVKTFYRGEKLYSEYIVPVSPLPATGVAGKLYFDHVIGEGYVWKNNAWLCVSKRVSSVVNNDQNRVSGVAVKDFVDNSSTTLNNSIVTDLLYTPATETITVVKGANQSSFQISKLASQLTYNTETGEVAILDVTGSTLSSVIVPLDNYVVSGTYDEVAKGIVFTLKNGSTVLVAANELVKIYHAGETGTVKVNITTIDGVNTIYADTKVSATANNGITIKTDGVYFDTESILKIADPVTSGDNVITVDGTNGHAKAGGLKLADISTKSTVDTMNTDMINTKVAASNIVTYANINTTAPSEDKMTAEDVITGLFWS